MKHAVIQSGGKQYYVTEGQILEVEHLEGEKDTKVTFNEVLLYNNDSKSLVGKPYVDGISVNAVILEHFKGNKIRVAKFKSKVRYRRVTGHRQHLTRIKIESVNEMNKVKEKSSDKANK